MQEKENYEYKNNNILFSILIPVYNVEKYIDRCIKSVLQQDVSNWELWLINDGSTDNSGRICHKYESEDSRIHVIDQENHGLISARRNAIRHAKGKYTLFLDSDDFWEENCLNRLYNIINTVEPDIIMYTGYLYYSDNLKHEMEMSFLEGNVNKEKIYEKIISSDELNAIWTKCIKTDILQKDPTDYSIYYNNSYGEDKLQFFYPITNCESVYYLPIPLYNYRQAANSMIHNLHVTLIEKKLHLEVWSVLFEYAKIWSMWDDNSKKLIGAYFLRHLISTFSIIYASSSSQDKQECLKYGWGKCIPKFVIDNNSQTLLTRNEKIKLFCMIHNNDMILKIGKIIKTFRR